MHQMTSAHFGCFFSLFHLNSNVAESFAYVKSMTQHGHGAGNFCQYIVSELLTHNESKAITRTIIQSVLQIQCIEIFKILDYMHIWNLHMWKNELRGYQQVINPLRRKESINNWSNLSSFIKNRRISKVKHRILWTSIHKRG